MSATLTTKEAAEKLGVSTARVRQMVLAGSLPAEKFGRDLVINEDHLALVSDRKPGRPKKPDEGAVSQGAQTEAATPETKAAVKKTKAKAAKKVREKAAGKGTATRAKPAKKRAANKGVSK